MIATGISRTEVSTPSVALSCPATTGRQKWRGSGAFSVSRSSLRYPIKICRFTLPAHSLDPRSRRPKIHAKRSALTHSTRSSHLSRTTALVTRAPARMTCASSTLSPARQTLTWTLSGWPSHGRKPRSRSSPSGCGSKRKMMTRSSHCLARTGLVVISLRRLNMSATSSVTLTSQTSSITLLRSQSSAQRN